MVFFKAEKLQRMAELLQQVQKAIEEEGGKTVDVEEDLSGVARAAGLDLEIARRVDADTLEAMLTLGGTGSPGGCWLTAEALFLDALVAVARGRDEEARHRLEKARRLYRILGSDVDLPVEAVPPEVRIRRIEELLE